MIHSVFSSLVCPELRVVSNKQGVLVTGTAAQFCYISNAQALTLFDGSPQPYRKNGHIFRL